jgi:hypothetical protein
MARLIDHVSQKPLAASQRREPCYSTPMSADKRSTVISKIQPRRPFLGKACSFIVHHDMHQASRFFIHYVGCWVKQEWARYTSVWPAPLSAGYGHLDHFFFLFFFFPPPVDVFSTLTAPAPPTSSRVSSFTMPPWVAS